MNDEEMIDNIAARLDEARQDELEAYADSVPINPAAYELELQMRLLLDAAMRYEKGDGEADLTEEERAHIKSWHIRDSEVWMGNVGVWDVVEDALYRHLHRIGDDLLKFELGGDQDKFDAVILRLCTRGPGGHYQRFMFWERP